MSLKMCQRSGLVPKQGQCLPSALDSISNSDCIKLWKCREPNSDQPTQSNRLKPMTSTKANIMKVCRRTSPWILARVAAETAKQSRIGSLHVQRQRIASRHVMSLSVSQD